jgi:hypothetical protein
MFSVFVQLFLSQLASAEKIETKVAVMSDSYKKISTR